MELTMSMFASSADYWKAQAEAKDVEIERLRVVLRRIAELHPSTDSKDGMNEWGEADCFDQAQQLARDANAHPY